MSERVTDLRQASVNEMLRHLGGLVEAIQRSNERFIRQDRELGELHTKVDRLLTEMRNGFRDVRSDLVAMENRLLTAEHKAARSELLPRAGDDDAA
jgi:hypothetical protein